MNDIKNKDFIEKINTIKVAQQNLINILEDETLKLKREENIDNNNMINISINEINNYLLNLLKNNVIKNINNKLNEYFKEYEKYVKAKISNIKENANFYFLNNPNNNNQIKCDIIKINDNFLNNCFNEVKEIIKNLNIIKSEINREKEKYNKNENMNKN